MKLRKLFFIIIRITLPFVVLMNAVVLLFNPWFLKFEYSLKDFPKDEYGFTDAERLDFGSQSIEYITKNYADDFMRDLHFSDGSPLYNEREISHMHDVQRVYQGAKLALRVLIVFYMITILLVYSNPDSIRGFIYAVRDGAVLTLGLIAAVIAGIFIDFDALFTAFHKLFFTGGSWLFYADDSLIRLYPEKLWSDSFILLGIMTVVTAFVLLIICKSALKNYQHLA